MTASTEPRVASTEHQDRPWEGPEAAVPIWKRGTSVGLGGLVVAGIGCSLVGLHALSIPTPPCPLRTTTGFPCPFCGMTHLAHAVLTGRFGAIITNDPAGLGLAAALAVIVITQVVAMATKSTGPAFMTSRALMVVVAGLLAVHWGTTIVTGGLLAV